MGHDEPPLLTTRDVAARLGVHPKTVQQWVSSGRLHPTLRLPGGALRFLWTDVRRQLDEQDEQPPEA